MENYVLPSLYTTMSTVALRTGIDQNQPIAKLASQPIFFFSSSFPFSFINAEGRASKSLMWKTPTNHDGYIVRAESALLP